jgi:hypothetical protein
MFLCNFLILPDKPEVVGENFPWCRRGLPNPSFVMHIFVVVAFVEMMLSISANVGENCRKV